MTWTKIGAEFLSDPTVLSLPRGARLLHIEATIWSNQHGTDGHIPAHMISRITDEPDVTEAVNVLVRVGMWNTEPTGFLLADFLDNQPSADDVERTRVLDRERQRRQRQHRNGDHSLCDPRYCRAATNSPGNSNNDPPVTRDAARDSGMSHDARTDPYRTDPSRKSEGSGTGTERDRKTARSATDPTEPDGSSVVAPRTKEQDQKRGPLKSIDLDAVKRKIVGNGKAGIVDIPDEVFE